MQTSPVGLRKKIAKPLYLIEKTLSLVKNKLNRELRGFKDLLVYVHLKATQIQSSFNKS